MKVLCETWSTTSGRIVVDIAGEKHELTNDKRVMVGRRAGNKRTCFRRMKDPSKGLPKRDQSILVDTSDEGLTPIFEMRPVEDYWGDPIFDYKNEPMMERAITGYKHEPAQSPIKRWGVLSPQN